MNKYFLVGLIFLACTFNIAYSDTQPLDQSLIQIVNKAQQRWQVNAISLSIGLPQGEIKNYVSGTMSAESKIPITPDSLFQVGSITKNFTAVIILQLAAQKKLSLYDPIGMYFPQYPKWRHITVLQLLNHTSGIYDYIDLPHFWDLPSEHKDKLFQPKELLALAYQHESYFKPDQGWHYSNTDYVLLGLIAQKVSGDAYTELIHELLQKADMQHSYYLPVNYSCRLLQQMVHGYFQNFDTTEINGSWGQAAAALVSTPAQIVMWVRKLFSGDILSSKSLTMMEQAVSVIAGKSSTDFAQPAYALGMFRMNTPAGLVWFTPGLTPGYRSLWVYMPCNGITFAYSISNNLMGVSVHAEMMREIITTLLADKTIQQQIANYQQNHSVPSYCQSLIPAAKWEFVKF